MQRLRTKLCAKYDQAISATHGGVLSQASLWFRGGTPDGDYNAMLKYSPHLQKHRVSCAKGLYGVLEIVSYLYLYVQLQTPVSCLITHMYTKFY